MGATEVALIPNSRVALASNIKRRKTVRSQHLQHLAILRTKRDSTSAFPMSSRSPKADNQNTRQHVSKRANSSHSVTA
jgi:hypothetical protein